LDLREELVAITSAGLLLGGNSELTIELAEGEERGDVSLAFTRGVRNQRVIAQFHPSLNSTFPQV